MSFDFGMPIPKVVVNSRTHIANPWLKSAWTLEERCLLFPYNLVSMLEFNNDKLAKEM